MAYDEKNSLMHYGTKRHSGRYPWGSGEHPYQHSGDFLSRIEELKKSGMTETEIAHELGLSTTQYRVQKQLATHERRNLERERALSLRADGKSLNEIAKIMGYKNDSSIRSLLDDNTAERKNRAQATAEILKCELKKKKMIDVGVGAERELGISETTMKEALEILKMEGFNVHGIGIPQVTNPGQQSNTKVLCGPDVAHRDVYQNMGDIQSVGDYHSQDGGATFTELKYVRVRVYNELTGKKEDVTLPKNMVAIIENPLYSVMNEPNSTMQRLIRKLNLLDAVDEQSSSGKLDLIIQLPYVIKTPTRKQQAEERRKQIEDQLSGSKYGIAYTDGTEKIVQLNRAVENNLMSQIEYLTSMLYSQLGMTQSILDGTADEKTMNMEFL